MKMASRRVGTSCGYPFRIDELFVGIFLGIRISSAYNI